MRADKIIYIYIYIYIYIVLLQLANPQTPQEVHYTDILAHTRTFLLNSPNKLICIFKHNISGENTVLM